MPELVDTLASVVEVVNERAELEGLATPGKPMLVLADGDVRVLLTDDAEAPCAKFFGTLRAIRIRRNCTPHDIVLVHEIGHTLGLYVLPAQHPDDPHSIMYAQVRNGWTLAQAADSLVAELVAHYSVPR